MNRLTGTKCSPNLFEYRDYRLFLRDYYDYFKKKKTFSLRIFSKRAGFKSINIYKLVMEGRRNLTEESFVKFMKGIRLNKSEREFFIHLVHFNQAKNQEEKDRHYISLVQCHQLSKIKELEKNQIVFYSSWYHSVIRELLVSEEFDGTPEWISEKLNPKVSVDEVKDSIELLLKLKLVNKTKGNRFVQSNNVITSGSRVSKFDPRDIHRAYIELAKNALRSDFDETKDICSLSLGVQRDQIPLIINKVQEFKKSILKIASIVTKPEEVMQMNIQVFPVTHVSKKKEKK